MALLSLFYRIYTNTVGDSNKMDLQLLSEMGLNARPPTDTRLRIGDKIRANAGKPPRRLPTIKVVALAVMAGLEMKKLGQEWAGQKKARKALGKELEKMVEGRKRLEGGKGKRVSTGK